MILLLAEACETLRIFAKKTLRKIQIMETIRDMSDEFSIDELIERLVVLQKIEEGQRQAKEGRVYTEEEVKLKLETWLK